MNVGIAPAMRVHEPRLRTPRSDLETLGVAAGAGALYGAAPSAVVGGLDGVFSRAAESSALRSGMRGMATGAALGAAALGVISGAGGLMVARLSGSEQTVSETYLQAHLGAAAAGAGLVAAVARFGGASRLDAAASAVVGGMVSSMLAGNLVGDVLSHH